MENKKQITLRLPDGVYGALKEEAKKKHITINELVNIILYDRYHSDNFQE